MCHLHSVIFIFFFVGDDVKHFVVKCLSLNAIVIMLWLSVFYKKRISERIINENLTKLSEVKTTMEIMRIYLETLMEPQSSKRFVKAIFLFSFHRS